MVMPALGLLSVDLWLTYLVTILLALRLHRALQFSDRVVAVLTQSARQRRSDRVR